MAHSRKTFNALGGDGKKGKKEKERKRERKGGGEGDIPYIV